MRNLNPLVLWLLASASLPAQTPGPGAAERTTTSTRSAATVASPAVLSAAGQPASSSPAATAKRVRLALTPSGIAAEKYRLFDSTGRAVTTAVRDSRTLEADVQPGRPYALLPPAMGRRTVTAAKLEFPARYVTFDQNGSPANEGGLFLHAVRVPLVWDDAARAYTTELVVGYDFKDGHEQALAEPKTVAFFAEGAGARIKADTVVISRSGVSGYQRVVLSTSQAGGDTSFTARASPVDEVQAAASIQREPGGFSLSLPAGRLDSFGVGAASLSISLLARDGAPLAAPQALQIHLSSRHLQLPATVLLPAGQTSVSAELRTIGLGDDEITAEAGLLKASLPVRAAFPFLSIAAAVFGGVLGGSARYLRNKRRSKSLFARRVVEGVLVGVLFVAAAWAGMVSIEINAGILTTPFGAFVLAAFSGYLGCLVLDRVANRMLPQTNG